MGNGEDLVYGMEVARESLGSVNREMEVVMQSFEKRVEVMKNAWASLADTTVNSDFIKGIVDATTAVIKLAEKSGGLTTVVLALGGAMTSIKVAEKVKEYGSFSAMIKEVAKAIVVQKTATEGATIATTGLSIAMKGLIGGAVVGAIMLLGTAINYIATSSERARERFESLKEEVSNMTSNVKTMESLASEFEQLNSKEFLTANESERLLEVQNQIKELQPEIGGYYDEQGNFIITQLTTAQELLKVQKDILKEKRKEALEAGQPVLKEKIADYEKQKKILEDINKETEKAERIKNGTASLWDKLTYTDEDTKSIISATSLNTSPYETINDKAKEAKNNMREARKESEDFVISTLSLTDKWEAFGEQQANAIRKTISEMSDDEIINFANSLLEGGQSAESLAEKLKEMSPVAEEAKDTINAIGDNKVLSSMSVVTEKLANDTDILSVATKELAQTQDITVETMEKLLQKYPELAGKITDTASAQVALAQKTNELNFDKATDDLATLVSISEDLEAGNGLTASSFKKLSETFPELLGYMNDEASLADAINMKMNELKDTQNQAYSEMLMNSAEYFQNTVKNNDEMARAMTERIGTLFSSLGVMYQDDMENWQTLAQGKAMVEEQLINALGEAWGEHFGVLSSQFNKFADNPIMIPQFDREKARKELTTSPSGLDVAPIDYFVEKDLNAMEKAFNQEVERANQFKQAMLDIADIFNDPVEFKPVEIKVGGTKTGGGGRKSSKSSKDSSYISSIFKDTVDEILRGGEEIERSMDETNSKLENAVLKGDGDLEKQLTARMSNLQLALRDKQASMAKELDVQLNKMREILAGTDLFKGMDLKKLTGEDLAKVQQQLEIKIDKANVSGNDKEVARLNKQKSLVQDIGQTYLDTIDKRRELSDKWWQEENNRLQAYADNVEKFYQKKFDKIEREDALLEMQRDMLIDDSGRYDKEEKEADKILAINKELYQNIVEKRKLCESQIAQLRAKTFGEESEEIRELEDRWLEYERARLDMIREIAEARRQAEISSAQKELSDLNYYKDNIDKLPDLTIQMLKEETELKKEALEEQYEAKKEALDKEYDAEREALEDKLDLLKEEADARKEALDKEKSEKDYNDKVVEKEKQIADVKKQIAELSLDDSASSVKKRKELEAQLAEYIKDLEDMQYDRSHELQKEAIDEELKNQEDKIKDKLDKLEEQYKEEEKLLEEKYQNQIKEYEDYLNDQKALKEEANRLIEQGDQAFYERLKSYALEYTDMLEVEFDDMWTKAYEALDKYGNKQMDVISVIELMTQRVIELNDELRRLDNTSYKDFIEGGDYEIGAGGSNSSSGSSSSDDKYDGLTDKEEKAKYRDKQLQKMIDLGNEMDRLPSSEKEAIRQLREQQKEIAKTIGAYMQGDTWYIMINDKKYRVRDAIGVRHSGLSTGEVGSPFGSFKIKANEELNKLEKGEVVVNKGQSQNIMENVKTLANKAYGGETKIIVDMHDFSITQDSLPKFEKLLKEKVPKIINDSLFSKGIK